MNDLILSILFHDLSRLKFISLKNQRERYEKNIERRKKKVKSTVRCGSQCPPLFLFSQSNTSRSHQTTQTNKPKTHSSIKDSSFPSSPLSIPVIHIS
ncbi:hypothetical protein L1887_01701 [Cichorium endivia]|nr:hypothetical protein L1887_01701 [Cichorium endivia]